MSVAIQSILGVSILSTTAFADEVIAEKLATITVTASQTEHDQKSAPATPVCRASSSSLRPAHDFGNGRFDIYGFSAGSGKANDQKI